MVSFLIRWIITTFAVFVAAFLMNGIQYDSFAALLGASLLLGIINAFIRPILLLLSLPFILVTMGFFILIINALLLRLVSTMVPGFHVAGFWSAFFGAILISFVSWILSAYFKASDGKIYTITHHGRMKRVSGKVIS